MKYYPVAFGIVLSLTSGLLFGCGSQAPPVNPPTPQASTESPTDTETPGQIGMVANLLTYDDPAMAIATRYPGNMTVDANCSGEGCGYFFKFKPQGNALDQAQVHLFLPRGAKTAADVERFVTDPKGLMASNGWTVTKNVPPPQGLTFPWVKQVISFSAEDGLVGQILIGETNGQGIQVTLVYPSTMANSFLPAASTILSNLQFKAEKLPLKPSQE